MGAPSDSDWFDQITASVWVGKLFEAADAARVQPAPKPEPEQPADMDWHLEPDEMAL